MIFVNERIYLIALLTRMIIKETEEGGEASAASLSSLLNDYHYQLGFE
jgi:hypothetical protein